MAVPFETRRFNGRAGPAERAGATLRNAMSDVAGLFGRIVQAYENRQLLHDMSAMSDHELSDIGLRRTDLSDATAVGGRCEVGSFLAERAAGRRPRRR